MWPILNLYFDKGKKTIVQSGNNGENGTTLTETISCSAIWSGEYDWTIDKTAIPSSLILSDLESGAVNYTITLHNDPLTLGEGCVISGLVCITNGGAVDTIGLTCTLELQCPPSDDIIYSQLLDISSMPVIPAGVTACYSFSFSSPSFTPGQTYRVTANTTILNHSGSIGIPKGPSEKCSGKYPKAPTISNNIINVTDSMFPLAPSKEFTAIKDGGDQYYNYVVNYTCNNEGVNNNTATIVETGDYSSATVNIFCSDATTSLEQNLNFMSSWSGEYDWSISKTVSKSTLDLFKGDSEKVYYTITVTNSTLIASSEVVIKGAVCIKNIGNSPTKDLFCLLDLRLSPGDPPLEFITVDLSSYPTLDPLEYHCYDFEFTFNGFTPGNSYYLTSTVTITNYDGHIGLPFGISITEKGLFQLEPTPTNSHITVLDSYKDSIFEFNAVNDGGNQSVEYGVIYSCDNEGLNKNTAKIKNTTLESSTELRVNCYCLKVSKTVHTSLIRRYIWDISKACIDPITKEELSTVTVSSLTYATLYYLVSVVPTITESNIVVYGDIKVKNPHPSKSIKVTVTDKIQSLQGDFIAIVEPSEYIIEAGQSKIFSYAKTLETVISGSNVATATYISNTGLCISYNSKSMIVDFNDAKVIEIDPCVNVFDSDYGKLNDTPVCRNSKSFYYSKVVGPYIVCCDCGKKIENTAIYTSETTTGSVTNIVTICVV